MYVYIYIKYIIYNNDMSVGGMRPINTLESIYSHTQSVIQRDTRCSNETSKNSTFMNEAKQDTQSHFITRLYPENCANSSTARRGLHGSA